MHNRLYDLLNEGDKRTVKNVDEAVQLLVSSPSMIVDLLEIIQSEPEAVSMRAADCLEKYSRRNTQQLEEHADTLMHILEKVSQKEVRWHLAQILPRLKLSAGHFNIASKIWLHDYYNSSSSIVRTESLQALFNIRNDYPLISSELKVALVYGLDSKFPAVKARASLLFRDL